MNDQIVYVIIGSCLFAFVVLVVLCYSSKCANIKLSCKGIEITRDVLHEEKVRAIMNAIPIPFKHHEPEPEEKSNIV